MLYQLMSQVGSRIICWQFEQFVIFDVLTRERHFYQNYKLERSYACFTFVNSKAYLIGGQDDDHNSLHDGKNLSYYQIMPF